MKASPYYSIVKLTQAILPVAGLGTRFLPWTKVVPKELLPLGRLPIIAWLIDECLSVGIREICLVISRGKELIPAFFAKDRTLEAELRKRGKSEVLDELLRYDAVRFTTVYQDKQLGDGHAILQAKDFVRSDHVAVLFGDDLIVGKAGSGLEQMLSAVGRGNSGAGEQWNSAAMLCLQDVPKEHVSRYGIAEVVPSQGRLKRITKLVEKPSPEKAPSTLGIVGKYIIPRSFFDVLPSVGAGHGGEVRLIDALIAQLGSIEIYGYVFEGKRYDTGTPEGYREAVVEMR